MIIFYFLLVALILFLFGLHFIKRPYVSLYLYFHYFKHVNLGKHIWIHTSKIFKRYAHFKISSRDEVFTHLFFILGWNFIPVFLTGMSSSQDEISSRQKRVNSKRHFTINRDDFVPGWNFTFKYFLSLRFSRKALA